MGFHIKNLSFKVFFLFRNRCLCSYSINLKLLKILIQDFFSNYRKISLTLLLKNFFIDYPFLKFKFSLRAITFFIQKLFYNIILFDLLLLLFILFSLNLYILIIYYFRIYIIIKIFKPLAYVGIVDQRFYGFYAILAFFIFAVIC